MLSFVTLLFLQAFAGCEMKRGNVGEFWEQLPMLVDHNFFIILILITHY